MEINIQDYVTEDDMRRIAEEEFRAMCRRSTTENFERILSNAAYAIVHKEVDEAFDAGMAETVKEKAIKIIQDFSAYSVFRAPNAWDKDASKGWTYMQAAIEGAKQLIDEKIESYVRDMPEETLRELVAERFADAMISRLAR